MHENVHYSNIYNWIIFIAIQVANSLLGKLGYTVILNPLK